MELFFFTTFGKAFLPKKVRPHLRQFFDKTGLDEVPYHKFGVLFWLAAALSLAVYLTQVYPLLFGESSSVFFLVTFVVFTAVMLFSIFVFCLLGYFYFNMRIYSRTKELEEKLPDYLTLVSTSLRGGYGFEQALWSAIKPEFGILAREIALVSKRVMTGNEVGEALRAFSCKYESPILRRSVELIISELESGGKVVEVIERVIVNLKKTKALKEEMSAATLTYMIFISALVMFIMPVLFALSLVLFTAMTGMIADVASNLGSSASTGFLPTLGASTVERGDYQIFIFLAISVISIFSSLIIGIIERGSLRGGIRYIPMFFFVSQAVYFIFFGILQGVFGSVFSVG